MNKDLIVKIGTGMEILGILGLMGIAFKRNNDCYKAERKLINTEMKLINTEFDGIVKDVKIRLLEDKVKELEK